LLLPSASVFLLLLCNDPEVLGPWINPSWLNAVASVIVGTLLMLSGTLMATTLFPHVDVTGVLIGISIALVGVGIGVVAFLRISARRSGRRRPPPPVMTVAEKMSWRMPPLTLLKPVRWSPGLRIGILSLRAYLVLSAVLLLVKAVQLGSH
jgi:hypothetical protein